MSIVRVGVGETKDYAEGWELIFGKKETQQKSESKATPESTASTQDARTPKSPPEQKS